MSKIEIIKTLPFGNTVVAKITDDNGHSYEAHLEKEEYHLRKVLIELSIYNICAADMATLKDAIEDYGQMKYTEGSDNAQFYEGF